MRTRSTRSASWAAYFSGITALLGLVSLILFFSFESVPGTSQSPHFWGPISDISPIFQMGSMLVVLLAFFRMQQTRASGLSRVGSAIGIIGMAGVVLLQFMLIVKVITFEQEVLPVLVATAVVGLWLILVNYLGKRQGDLPARLAWLGIAVGVAFLFEPVMLALAGGAVAWRVFMSNYLLLAGSTLVFLVSYIGFPIWAFWLGRVFRKPA